MSMVCPPPKLGLQLNPSMQAELGGGAFKKHLGHRAHRNRLMLFSRARLAVMGAQPPFLSLLHQAHPSVFS